jgi:hypothetical protein
MATYKKYTIKQNDTLELIAQQQLGNMNELPSIVSLNRLRAPFISNDPYDQLGTIRAQGTLSSSNAISINDTSVNVLTDITSGTIPQSVLSPQSIFSIKRYGDQGSVIFEKFFIKSYYPNNTQELLSDATTTVTIPEGTLVFDTPVISPPSSSAFNLGMISSIANSSFTSARNYYVRFTYCSGSSNTMITGETLASPNTINSTSGAAIPYSVQSGFRMSVSSPSTWPTGTVAVRLYISTVYGSESLQYTFTGVNDTYFEPVSFSSSSVYVPVSNTSKVGFLNSYPAGTTYGIHENSSSLSTQVLKTGETLLLPILSEGSSELIFNNADVNQFMNMLGTDILLDQNGIVSFNGYAESDLTTVTGIDNIRQAIYSRLITSINQLRTQPTYGNYAIDLTGEKYLISFVSRAKAAILLTLYNEPRIYKVTNMDVFFDANNSSLIINNLFVQVSSGSSDSTQINFSPIALPI